MQTSAAGVANSGSSLPDFVVQGVAVLSIGINPSPASVAAGYPFANPRNRFWPAARQSGLVSRDFKPTVDQVAALPRLRGLGFSDIVKRTTASASQLTSADFAAGKTRLDALIADVQPGCVWFQGITAWRRYTGTVGPITEGWQDATVHGRPAIVTANPSPANAKFSLAQIVASQLPVAAVLTEAAK